MFIIAVYDISTVNESGKKRLPKIMKIMREYLHHTQKSVFEGEISNSQFMALKQRIKSLTDSDDDFVIFYIVPDKKFVTRKIIGKNFDPNNTII